MGVLLEVAVAHERDVPGAVEGGADRLHLVGPGGDGAGLSPEITTVSAVCRETDLPVFVLLRLNDSWTTTGGELTRLVGLAEDYLAVGAKGVSFGFLDADTGVDAEVCTHLATSLPNVPWTFHDAVDDALDTRHAWRALVGLPGPGQRAVRGVSARHGRGVRRPARRRRDRPGDRRAGDAGPAGCSPSTCPGWSAPACAPSTSTSSSGRAAAEGRTSTRGWPAPGGCSSTRRWTGSMTLMIDPPAVPSRGRMWSHLASDTSFDELHAFARELGIPERGFDRDHYDVPSEWYDEVLARGVEPVTSRELVRRLVAAGLRRRKNG